MSDRGRRRVFQRRNPPPLREIEIHPHAERMFRSSIPSAQVNTIAIISS